MSVAKTAVFVAHPVAQQYLVLEPIEEVAERWKAALGTGGPPGLASTAGIVELTSAPGYWEPYAIALNPVWITHLEVANEEAVRFTEFAGRRAWEQRRTEMDSADQATGFGS